MPDTLTRLSDRQIEILYLVGKDGLEYAEVAAVLGISESTIRVHVDRILAKHQSKRLPREGLTEIYWRYAAGSGDAV